MRWDQLPRKWGKTKKGKNPKYGLEGTARFRETCRSHPKTLSGKASGGQSIKKERCPGGHMWCAGLLFSKYSLPSLPNGGCHTLRCPLMSGLAMWISLANGSASGQDERKGLRGASVAWFCSWTPIICHNKSIPWIVPSHKSQNKYMRYRSKSTPQPGPGPPNSADPRSAQKQPT